MLRFSANLSMLFGEYDFLARFEKLRSVVFAALNLCFLMTTTLKN
ncbi:hydroxypyruvate isomerase [Escherichia coli]|uniref:Hydroxypyruvate isomerase n=1 Tax=Escherichia coli TaxID=562 RepID=A0A2X1N1F9_ECOLX|nr:hydroxypyruvate isomerase [Escherichia coli]